MYDDKVLPRHYTIPPNPLLWNDPNLQHQMFPFAELHICSMPAIHVRNQELPESTVDNDSTARA